MSIRPGKISDVPEIVRMSGIFYPETHYAQWCGMDDDTVADLAANLIENHVFMVAEEDGHLVGMIGLFIIPFMFNRYVNSAGEVIFWVDPKVRGSMTAVNLLKSIEEPCRLAGADRIQMVHMPNSPPQAAALYTKLGYFPSESSYTKDI